MASLRVFGFVFAVVLLGFAQETQGARGFFRGERSHSGLDRRPLEPLPRMTSYTSNPYRAKTTLGGSLPVYNVEDYGAKGDNSTDNTGPFQDAINAAASADGGEVYVPPGLYLFEGSITVMSSVSLVGSFLRVPSHGQGTPLNDGSILMPLGGQGNESATPFISIQEDATMTGFTIFYPNQLGDQVPIPFPYSVYMNGNNAAITDVELLNSFNGISAVGAHRHYIARIQGQPLNVGLFIDQTYDIGRVEDVHFNPWFSDNPTYLSWQMANGQAFVLGRSDWEYMLNCFAFGYAVGYHFVQTSTGMMNGNFLGLGADLAINSSILVDAAQAPGLLFTNGEFTSFIDPNFAPYAQADSTQVVVSASNTGPVQFVNSAFWGPSDHIARLYGGTTTFANCNFVQWDLKYKNGSAAIQVLAGDVILQGNNFMQAGNQVELSSQVDKAIIVGNMITGPLNIVDHGAKNVQNGYNAHD